MILRFEDARGAEEEFPLPVNDRFDFTDLAFVDFESHCKNDSGPGVRGRSRYTTQRTCRRTTRPTLTGTCRTRTRGAAATRCAFTCTSARRRTARTCSSACSSSSGGCRRVGIRSFINDGLCERAAAFRVDKGSLKLRLAAGFEKTFAQLDLRSILGDAEVRRCLQRGHVVCFNGLEIVGDNRLQTVARTGLCLSRNRGDDQRRRRGKNGFEHEAFLSCRTLYSPGIELLKLEDTGTLFGLLPEQRRHLI